jgi:DNA invertase Pin-like site-specific DNA recombinase
VSKIRRAIGIVRVSVVGGREGESFASPAEQRDRIEAACKAEGIRLATVHEELDVSGGRPLDQRDGLRAAIEAVEAGKADVIIAAYLDRLCRSLDVQRQLVERVESAGGEVRALDVGAVSHATATTKLSATLLGAFAEYQRDRARENARASHARAIARGVAPWPNIIPGYRKGPDDVLVPYTPEVEPVREAFRMRAEGAPVAKVRAHLAAHGIKRSEHGTASLLESRVVLGELVFGEHRNPAAHAQIVDRDTWKRAQEVTVPRGRMAPSSALLARLGVLRCAGCGGRMTVGTNRNGKYPAYRCPGKGAADCDIRSSISASIAEGVVIAATRAAIADIDGRADGKANRRQAEADLASAESALDAAVSAFDGLGDLQAAKDKLGALGTAVDDARERLERLGAADLALTINGAEDWDKLSREGQRELIRTLIATATVSPGHGADRITIAAA